MCLLRNLSLVLWMLACTAYAQAPQATIDTIKGKALEAKDQAEFAIEDLQTELSGALDRLQTPKETEFNGTNFDRLQWNNSLMFEDESLKPLYDILATPEKKEQEFQPKVSVNEKGQVFDLQGTLLGTITAQGVFLGLNGEPLGRVDNSGYIVDNQGVRIGIDTRAVPAIPTIAPAFYLNSTLFYTPDNWTIWVNHRRIRKGTVLNGLTITHVQKDFVDYLWEPADLEIISPQWRDKMIPLTSSRISRQLGKALTAYELKLLKDAATTPSVDSELPQTPQQKQLKQEEAISQAIASGENPALPVEAPPPPLADSLPTLEELPAPATEISPLEKQLKENEIQAEEARQLELEKKKSLAEQKRLEAVKKANLRFANQGVDESAFTWTYKSADGNILIDELNNRVKFRLGVNQTFVSHTMEITEGYRASTQLQIDPETKKEWERRKRAEMRGQRALIPDNPAPAPNSAPAAPNAPPTSNKLPPNPVGNAGEGVFVPPNPSAPTPSQAPVKLPDNPTTQDIEKDLFQIPKQ